MVQLNWLKDARTDLKEIYEYIKLDSLRYANFQIESIQERTQILKAQPLIGKQVFELDDESVRELIEGNYRIIYRIVSKNRIDILMIHHSARDLQRRINR